MSTLKENIDWYINYKFKINFTFENWNLKIHITNYRNYFNFEKNRLKKINYSLNFPINNFLCNIKAIIIILL